MSGVPTGQGEAGSPAEITVAVLSYDGIELLRGLLPTLAGQVGVRLDVVVVDNGSSDGTAEWLAVEWPQVRVVRLPENVGVTPALNVCVEAARAEFLALLNNDLELDRDALARLVAALRAHPRAGSASPKLMDFHDRTVLDGAGDEFSWTGMAGRRGHGEKDVGQYDDPEWVFGACGGAAVYRTEALRDVGRFDERFFAFYEDVDWALRAQVAGWGCRYVPSAVVFHMGSATIGKGLTDFTRYQLWRNGLWLVAKCYPARALVLHAPALIFGQALNLAVAVRDGKLDVWLRVVRDAARGGRRVGRARRGVQRRRRASLADLDAVIR